MAVRASEKNGSEPTLHWVKTGPSVTVIPIEMFLGPFRRFNVECAQPAESLDEHSSARYTFLKEATHNVAKPVTKYFGSSMCQALTARMREFQRPSDQFQSLATKTSRWRADYA